MSRLLADLLTERDYLLADGAIGTNLVEMGLPTGCAPDLWNLDEPANVTRLHEAFVRAGCDIVLTNTFGANRIRLEPARAADRVTAINEAGARLAREVADRANRAIVVAGSMGPTGAAETLPVAQCEAAFAEQAEALAAVGVDVLWIETMYRPDEISAAIAAATRTGLPIAATATFHARPDSESGTPGPLLEGVRGRVIAYGANCGEGPALLIDTLRRLGRDARPGDVLIAKGNGGIPQRREGRWIYPVDDTVLADYARMARDCGARIIGGCCGTTPEHLGAMRRALATHRPRTAPSVSEIEAALGPIPAAAPLQSR